MSARARGGAAGAGTTFPVDLHIHGGQPHAFDASPAFGRLCAQEVLVFLDRYL